VVYSEKQVNSIQFNGWLTQRFQPSSFNPFAKPLLMGVLNVTPDSFFDGGNYLAVDNALQHALSLIQQGADIIDIGGESTKPYAKQVSLEVELTRVIPVIKKLRRESDVCISIDTYKPEVMQAAVEAGANIINDIYALRQPGALTMAAQLAVPVCLMHMQGEPSNMQQNPYYRHGVVDEICQFFTERIKACELAGINKNLLLLDPGFGFGKLIKDNLQLVYNLQEFFTLGMPILLGISRKNTIGAILDKETDQRLIGSLTLALFSAMKGVGILRTHDVDETRQALKILEMLYQENS